MELLPLDQLKHCPDLLKYLRSIAKHLVDPALKLFEILDIPREPAVEVYDVYDGETKIIKKCDDREPKLYLKIAPVCTEVSPEVARWCHTGSVYFTGKFQCTIYVKPAPFKCEIMATVFDGPRKFSLTGHPTAYGVVNACMEILVDSINKRNEVLKKPAINIRDIMDVTAMDVEASPAAGGGPAAASPAAAAASPAAAAASPAAGDGSAASVGGPAPKKSKKKAKK